MYKEKAIPLVTVDQDGKYVFQEEAAEFLRSLQGPIGVISVAGLYRTGKSYLLNRMLLNRSNGFGVGSTINACTKGLWVWGTPLKGQSADGDPINIIIIDTEGIGAVDEDSTHDTKIFTLAILASSCFIYNSSGSIDEGAIQNLSLVVNLTKHIHLKTQSKQEEDPDDFANFFPSFFWVVRDFSLQLVDPNGHSITSQEYLENALAAQKGNSTDVEEKNRIRKLLTAFFKERECFTLVRPHIDEDKLRELDGISFDQLRPEFVEQVMTFRKRLLGRMKPKVINQKKLNGEMYTSLLGNYVKAINEGAVPNIENAWNYMCREQCEKTAAEAYQSFENKLKENLSQKWPCTEEDFRQAARGAKTAAYDLFRKKAFGDNMEEYFLELKKRMKSKVNTFKIQNEKESAAAMHSYIVKNFAQIERKLKLQEYKTYAEFEKQLNQFYNELIEKGPRLVNRQVICLEFMKKILPQGAGFFFKVHENEFEKLKTLTDQKEKNLDRQLKDAKEEMAKDKNVATEKLYSVDKEKMEMILKIEKLQEEVQLLTRDKEAEIQRLSQTLQSKTSELESVKKCLQSKMEEVNSKNEEMNIKLVSGEKEWDKDKAIFEQRIKLLMQQVEDLQKKEKSFDSTINSSKTQSTFELREASLKFEKSISELTLELNEAKDKNGEFSEELKVLKEEHENSRDKFEKKEKKYKEDLSQRIKEIERMKHETQLEKNKLESDYLNDKDQLAKEFRELTDTSKQQDINMKTMSDQLKTQKSSYDMELAILTQKLGFAEESLRDAKQQLMDTKRSHEASIVAMEEANGKLNEDSENERMIELKNQHLIKVKELEMDNESTKKKLQFDIDNLNRFKDDLELKITLLDSTLMKERQETQEGKRNTDEKLEQLTNELNNLERLKNGRIKQQELLFENKIKELERELEDVRDRSSYEQRESHNKSEEVIIQLKNYYELEKEKLESKIGIEKEKADKKLKKATEELETKHKEEVATLEEENDELREEFMNVQNTLQNTVMELEHDRDIKVRQIDNLEKNSAELKQTYGKREGEMNAKYESLFQQSKAEKQTQYERIELLQNDNNNREKSIMSLTHAKEQLETTLEKRQALVEEQKREILDLRVNSEKTIEDHRRKYQELSNEYLEKKISYEKSIALISQESEYNARKVKDTERQIESNNTNYQERIKAIREEAGSQITILKDKEESFRITLEAKYDKLKKNSRETETTLQKTITELDKEKAIESEKFITLEQRYRDLEQKRQSESETLTSQLSTAKEALAIEKKALQSDIDRYKMLVNELENSRSESQATYQKDKILWENKLNFLEQQKEQNRVEYTEKVQKLENALEVQQRNRMSEKSSTEFMYNDHCSKLEKKHSEEVHRYNEEKTKRQMEYESTVKELEMTVKNMKEKYELDIHSKAGSYAVAEKRLIEIQENEKKLLAEVERLRQDRDFKNLEHQKLIEQQKEAMKTKIRDVEDKLKKIQNEKRSSYFEHEKEKARWTYEEEHLKEKIESLVEHVQKNSNDLEKLQRENERLKAERKNSKVSGAPSFIAKFGVYGDKSPAPLNKSALGGQDTTFVLNSSDINSEDRENDPSLKPINC